MSQPLNSDSHRIQILDLKQQGPTRVSHLDISRNDLGDAGMNTLAKWLETSCLTPGMAADIIKEEKEQALLRLKTKLSKDVLKKKKAAERKEKKSSKSENSQDEF